MGLPETSSNRDDRASCEQTEDGLLDEDDTPASELTDGRCLGDFKTRYPSSAWIQIAIEFIYLLAVIVGVSICLLHIGQLVAADSPADHGKLWFGLSYPEDRRFLIWITVALSGSVGGCAFAFKWLYHSVAKWTWNRDRILWRMIVPGLSGIFAVFVAFMVSAEIVPFLNSKVFDNFYMALGIGFLIGYFSDNVLAALQNIAVRWFGTVDRKGSEGG